MVASIKPEIMIIYLNLSCSAATEWSNLISRDPLISSALALSIFIFRGDMTITYTLIHSFSMQVASELQWTTTGSESGDTQLSSIPSHLFFFCGTSPATRIFSGVSPSNVCSQITSWKRNWEWYWGGLCVLNTSHKILCFEITFLFLFSQGLFRRQPWHHKW